MPKIQGTEMIDELVLLYRGMGQHDKALDVRWTPTAVPKSFGLSPSHSWHQSAGLLTTSGCASVVSTIAGDCQEEYKGVGDGSKAVLSG